MEVSVASMESIRPWSAATHDFKPYNLCLLDQLAPARYSPLILFYPIDENVHDQKVVARQLKASLSKTLDAFYPIAGRAKDNLVLHDFQQGVPFVEARVEGRHLSDFLAPPPPRRGPVLEHLNNLLPFQPPMCPLPAADRPQVAVQLNTFDCGGIAIGLNMYHKIMDGGTASTFLHAWAANCSNGSGSGTTALAKEPELHKASLVFPPRDWIPPEYYASMDKMFFQDVHGRQPVTARRFVFDSHAIATLRSLAQSSTSVTNPTRLEALSAFIWESALKATADVGKQQLQCFLQAVNLRPLISPRLSKRSLGSLTTAAMAYHSPSSSSCSSKSMKELVGLLRDGTSRIDEKYVNDMASERWFAAMLDSKKAMGQITGKQLMTCSSWVGFGTNNYDFGWGKPVWSGLYGDPTGDHLHANNVVVFKELAARGREGSNAIEAWIWLDEDVMAVLEHDPHFTQYASHNPPIILSS